MVDIRNEVCVFDLQDLGGQWGYFLDGNTGRGVGLEGDSEGSLGYYREVFGRLLDLDSRV